MSLPPLRFEPIFKENLWGGSRLPAFLRRPAPRAGAIGEAWVLSDVDGSPSIVADGPHAGKTLRQLLAADARAILGSAPLVNGRFPLLLKFIDARQELSVQVHPDDAQAAAAQPGANGKTEAWVILRTNPDTSRVYAGFREGVTAADFRAALVTKTVPQTLHCFTPAPGDCVFLEAGTVHAIGAELVVFEVQQTCDITYRLYDWDRVDEKTKQPRELHVEQGLACADFTRGPCPPVTPTRRRVSARREPVEWLADCQYFTLFRQTSETPFVVGENGLCRLVVCVAGSGELVNGTRTPVSVGDVVLLPASSGAAVCHPAGSITLLECGVGPGPAR
ncbi:type I phosphomannose isomerase catalytic subunit [Urbifossiella limnaea]|uniref:Mannose-6-phosphate isomerase YvyI n=1 Tax=Urbifossiella limnaea TaxID=2528023 RepID=A0A517XY82_9BACT|nr:type I phosphomannose isomerase catalytic subunit [Urbifossiella limnaea]QDU22490.1 Putative mannose-6-phosphate isomerase YvyI [Urbifossiella limnaea]